MGSGTQHEHSGLPGEEGDKAPSLMEKVMGLSDSSLRGQSGEGRDGAGVSNGNNSLLY